MKVLQKQATRQGIQGLEDYFGQYLQFLEKSELYPLIPTIDGASFTPSISIRGKQFLTFSSNNYLGLAGNKLVIATVKRAVEKYGIGSASTRLLSGTLEIQLELEKALARFFGYNDSITFSSGYLANVGSIRMLIDPFPYFQLLKEEPGVIVSDELNHASIIDATRLAHAERVKYRHSDMTSLEEELARQKHKRKLIVTDGVFSMDGDLAKIGEIMQLASQYNALVMVDDSHGVGVLGKNGRGVIEMQKRSKVTKETNVILMGSLTKAFGSIGGFIAADKDITNYLRITARSYIFSDPIPPAFVAGLIETVKLIQRSGLRRKQVLQNARYLRTQLEKRGFSVLGSETPIVPIFIGDERKAITFSKMLWERKILAPCIRRPAVHEGKERIRFSVMATHTEDQLDFLITICEVIGRKLGLI